MINKLKLSFSQQENPFDQDRNSDLVWGKIDLDVVDNDGHILQQIIDMVWDVKELVRWILGNESCLYNDDFPDQYDMGGESLAEIRNNYYELCRSNDEVDDRADELLEDYTVHHNIRYGMSGSKTKNVFIGKRNDMYEISYYNSENSHWVYHIDLKDFINHAKGIAKQYLM